ncbi:type IV pilus twitching motility protein PilT [Candidatus Saccharibacteria bacterium]|nr:type IV pilus twitching motility protein PilT [Candidatus Saccharibacteria bacterium]
MEGSGLRIETLLDTAVNRNASDLHIQVGSPPTFRINGQLIPYSGEPLSQEAVLALVHAVLDVEQQKLLESDRELDTAFAFGTIARFRLNAFHEKGHLAAAFRLIPKTIPSFMSLGIPAVVETFTDFSKGLVLITGPTGSGKTTTLAALINKINHERALHIITIEDPIEYTYESKRSLIVQREVHYDTFSFNAALRSSLRQDPDVILVGEMRDLETISSAITLAETGHLVFATLHTNSAGASIDRMVNIFPAEQQLLIRAQLANILQGICSQRLLPALKGGRIAACEILVANHAVRGIIREGKTHQLDAVIQTGIDQGMQTMDRTLAKLVKNGTISYDVAIEAVNDLPEFERMVRR